MFIWSLGGHSTPMGTSDNMLIGTCSTWEMGEPRKLVGAFVGGELKNKLGDTGQAWDEQNG